MKNLALLLMALFLVSCNDKSSKTEPEVPVKKEIDLKAELHSIEETRSNVMLALKEGRYEDIGKWVTPDARTIRPGGPGFDEMFALGIERGRFPYDSIKMTPTETFIMNDSMAYDWGTSKTYYTNNEGEPIELKNSFLVILKKMDGIWKLHREVASSVLE